MNPTDRLLTVFTDPIVIVAIVTGVVAIVREFILRGPKKEEKKKAAPPVDPIPSGQEIPTTPAVDHASGRVDDLKVMLRDATKEAERHEKQADYWRAKASTYLTERNAAWDRLRIAHHEEPPFRSDRAIAQVIPNEDELHGSNVD